MRSVDLRLSWAVLVAVWPVLAAGCGPTNEPLGDTGGSVDGGDVPLDTSPVALDTGVLVADDAALPADAPASCTGTDERACGNRLLYCAHPDTDPCGEADPAGVCQPRPTREECGATSEIVCGCDGRSYESACGARRWSVGARGPGECAGATTYPCGDGHRCRLGSEYCISETYMSGAMSFDTIFYCRDLPTTCAAGGMPTCAACFPSESCEERDPPGALFVQRSS